MLRNLCRISSKVSDTTIRTQLVHTCILSKINFCSSLYYTINKKQQYQLDKLINSGEDLSLKFLGEKDLKVLLHTFKNYTFYQLDIELSLKLM